MPFRPALIGAGALAMAVAGAPALPARAAGPEAVPGETWWGVRAAEPLRERPLRVLAAAPAVEIEGEWSPLYRDGDGTLVEGTRRAARLFGAAGAWRGAVEAGETWAVARGGGDRLWLGAQEFRARRATLAVGRAAALAGLAAAISSERGLPPGFGVAARVRPMPGVRFEAGASQAHARGALSVSWDDTEVRARGRWFERRAHWRLEAGAGIVRWSLGQEALDRRGAGGGEGDQVEPWLGWRETRATAAARLAGIEYEAEAAHGDGFQAVRVRRAGELYAQVEGPVRCDALSLRAGPAASRVRARAWAGRWSGDGAGVLSLWPFEPLTALTGTRRAARSSASLAHRGLSVERDAAGGPGWTAGLALWAIAPRAEYDSWQTTLLGLGRDDYSTGSPALREALLLGIRLGGSFAWSGVSVAADAVQWLPVRVRETTRDGGGDSGGPGTGGGLDADAGSSSRGGTVLRVRIGAGR